MKICYITLGFMPATKLGGPIQNSYSLTQALARRGHEVTVWCGNLADKSSKLFCNTRRSRFESVEVVYFNTHKLFPLGMGSFGLFFWPDLISFCRKQIATFDMVHLDGYRDFPTLIASYFCRRGDVPYAIQARGTMKVLFNSVAAKRMYDRLFGRTILQQGSLFVASSSKEMEDYTAVLGQDPRIRKIYNGVPAESLAELPPYGEFRMRHGWSGQLLITYLGRVHPSKGIEVLLRAFAAIRNRPGARLALIGPDEGFGSHLMALAAELGIPSAVTLLGALSGRDKLAAYVDSDLVVYATRSESFGMVPLESVMCGTPVIISTECGVRELLEPLGVAGVVPYGDVAALAAQIDAWADVRERMGGVLAEARELLGRVLSWDKVAQEYEQAYLSARASAGSRHLLGAPAAPLT
jgi:glycosyltransferase involved in cell wall biosynthesis